MNGVGDGGGGLGEGAQRICSSTTLKCIFTVTIFIVFFITEAELLSQLSSKQSIDESRNDQVMRLKEEVESLRGNKRQLEKQIEEKESLVGFLESQT